jgi:S1-C subfamily serine protease
MMLTDIVTSNHVVNGNTQLDLTFSDGRVYRAKLIGSDPFADLAVLYVQGVSKQKLVPLALGDSTGLQVCQEVAAVGNPFGLSASMTQGVISGLWRLMPSDGNSASRYSIPDIIQTDARINPGNSGGPLLDLNGQIIGIASTIFSAKGEFSGAGFAIPSSTIKKIVQSLITKGYFDHPWLEWQVQILHQK